MSDFIVYFFSDYAANTYAAQMEAIDMSLILIFIETPLIVYTRDNIFVSTI